MIRFTFLLFFTFFYLINNAQVAIQSKKYPSLLWEISGNGLKKPSYVFGTMHVSSKIAFHLSDSFYQAINSVDIVALETNPESWQEYLTRFDIDPRGNNRWKNVDGMPSEYLTINSLQFNSYEKLIEEALFVQPATINNLLYRNYSDMSGDFEEDTFLDMYIYQLGKKLSKKITGVERYEESMRLMMEAYRDAAGEKNKQNRNLEYDETLRPDKIQDAYRAGNLDLLDSINRVNSFSEAFDEKFLYSRNHNQADAIDSIIKTKASLFAGVGAAHLPGERGVIELLRNMGYQVKPVFMGKRDSRKKDLVENVRVPVSFSKQVAADSFFSVNMPGKFYQFDDGAFTDQSQYADMANGSYYAVNRVRTNALFWGHSAKDVYKKTDSLLYENIPGKILQKKMITRNGYMGFDIINRTRRGDFQRYNIFITPAELLVFKMSGNGDYVTTGNEASKFFGSIQLKEIKKTGWQTYSPTPGGYSILFPHQPWENFDGNWQADAEDAANGTHYTVIRSDINNFYFAGEDRFDLHLMDESFSSSSFISATINKDCVVYKGYPALNVTYRNKNGSYTKARFIIQGPHYYSLIAQVPKENTDVHNFFDSFTSKPFIYGKPRLQSDTSLLYTVNSPVILNSVNDKKIFLTPATSVDSEEEITLKDSGDIYRNRIIEDEHSGEKIYVSYYKPSVYSSNNTSEYSLAKLFFTRDDHWHIRQEKQDSSSGYLVKQFVLSDSNSSRSLYIKSFTKNEQEYLLVTQGDTLTNQSSFINQFFESFTPAEKTIKAGGLITGSNKFFTDFFSADSVTRANAILSINKIKPVEKDISMLKDAIVSLKWSEKNYLQIKQAFIKKLGEIKTAAGTDLLVTLYYATNDTIELQYTVLKTILKQRIQPAYKAFSKIVMSDPPVINFSDGIKMNVGYTQGISFDNNFKDSRNEDFMGLLFDSLELTKTILPEILPLLNLDDYEPKIKRLLAVMADSNLVNKKVYAVYFNKFYAETRLALKKQVIAEKRKAILKATNEKNNAETFLYDVVEDYDELIQYAALLIPFWEEKSIPALFNQLLSTNNEELKFKVMQLMMRHQKKIPDSLIYHFASLDNYRFSLYNYLAEKKLINNYPSTFNTILLIAQSRLFISKKYSKPDSLVYLDKLPATMNGQNGFIYFYKYRQRKNDVGWKLAATGLLPPDDKLITSEQFSEIFSEKNSILQFSEYTDIRLRNEEPLGIQLQKIKKRIIYQHSKSGKEFYSAKENFQINTDSEF